MFLSGPVREPEPSEQVHQLDAELVVGRIQSLALLGRPHGLWNDQDVVCDEGRVLFVRTPFDELVQVDDDRLLAAIRVGAI